ncbi:MAG: 2-amino-4-hydroxy-6-hydroxymethyldihydropteridine diphosphokinase [Legionellaceae bacterium]|nr:2-amino-4-hydroxy-6-hydroxymethyldihydropteridine diphosphokinase [Legionellaceae bacterium]
MTTCYLALGSNLNRPERQVRLAIRALRRLPASRLTKVSSLYRSTPANGIIQPSYCNAVVLLETHLPAHILLQHCQSVEAQQKRKRLKRFNARTLDIDILLYGTQTIQTPTLTVPHPRLHLRDFVLQPLLEIWPNATLPEGTKLTQCLKSLQVRRIFNLSLQLPSS